MRVEQPPPSYAGRTRYTHLEYEAVLANASIGIAFTRDRKFFLCNPRFAELFGWDADDMIGQPGEIVYPTRESYEALGRIAVPLLASGGQLDTEWEMRRKDGSTFPCRIIAKAINPENTQHGTIWIAEDATERKRTDEAIQRLLKEQEAILENAMIGIVFLKDRRVMRCNRRFEELFGYDPGELLNRSTRDLYRKEEDYAAAGRRYDDLAHGESVEGQMRMLRKDGTTFLCHLSGRAVHPGDPAQGSVWLFDDITLEREAEQRVQRALAEQQLILDNATVGIAFVRNRVIQRCSHRLEEMTGWGPGDLDGKSTLVLYAEREEWERAGRESYGQSTPGMIFEGERTFKRKDGTVFRGRTRGRRIDAGGGADQEWIWSYEDVTAEREAEERLRRTLAEQELILGNATVGIGVVRQRMFQRCNRQLETMFAYEPGELVGKSVSVLYASQEEFDEGGQIRYPILREGRTFTDERRVRRKDGTLIWCKVVGRAIDPSKPDEGSIWIYDDVTAERSVRDSLERAVAERTTELETANQRLEAEIAERKQAEERAQHLADHDALTGLPNRRLLEDRLTQALALSYRNRKITAVMFVDLDRFKTINDSLGHAVGDALLKEVAQRLVKQMRVGDTICRIGGDEFVVVLPELKRSPDAAQVAQKVIENLSRPVAIEERDLTITPSIGISVFPDDGRDAETLIRNADAAMYHAKEMGRANYQFFTDQMNLAASRRLSMESDLRRALKKGELRVYYQPIIELGAGCVSGHEALMRWQHPSRGLVAPIEFIQLAEETGLILKMGAWVLAEACRWATFIGSDRGLPVAVNLSPRQFMDPRLVETVAAALKESGLPAKLLELEITESTAMQHTDLALSTMKKLKELGVSIVIDDFGTGYSSLAYLKRFPVDKLKIDKSFLTDLNKNKEHRAIVAAIIALAHALGIKVVAEGVETEAQLEFLQTCRCDYIQGNLSGPPADAETAAKEYV